MLDRPDDDVLVLSPGAVEGSLGGCVRLSFFLECKVFSPIFRSFSLLCFGGSGVLSYWATSRFGFHG